MLRLIPIIYRVHRYDCRVVPCVLQMVPVARGPPSQSFNDGVLKTEEIRKSWAEKESTAEPECVEIDAQALFSNLKFKIDVLRSES